LAQILKEDVRQRIVDAALHVFADKGHAAAKMGDIADLARVSTGNLYRYFENKDVLFAEVVPTSLARKLGGLVRQRVESLRGEADVRTLGARAPWRVVSEELLAFCIANRLATIVLLGKDKAAGTEHETFSERMVHELVRLAVEHASSVGARLDDTKAERFALERIYRGLVDTMTAILEQYQDDASIRAAVEQFSTYHLAGMKAFIEKERP
jgi:AcrR family transcriptional regulator